MRGAHIAALDGYRALAVGLVMLCHLPVALPLSLPAPVRNLAANGWMGVDLFFVLSGFLITGILLRTRERPHYFRNFWIRRILRIFPLYYGLLLVIVVPAAIAGAPLPFPPWTGFAFLTNFWLAHDPAPDLGLVIMWSLAVEEQFYAVWPWFVRWTSRRALLVVILAMIVAAPLLRAWYLPTAPGAAYAYTWCRMDALAYGALAAWLLHGRWDRLVAACAWLVAPVAALGLLFGTVATWDRATAGFVLLGYPTIAVGSAVVVLGLAAPQAGAVARSLAARPFAHVGKVSYGLYLLHSWVFLVVASVLAPKLPALGTVGTLVLWGVAVALSVAVSTLVFRTVEAPILAWKDRLAPYTRPSTGPVAPPEVSRPAS